MIVWPGAGPENICYVGCSGANQTANSISMGKLSIRNFQGFVSHSSHQIQVCELECKFAAIDISC